MILSFGHEASGALAGNGGSMAVAEKKSNGEETKSTVTRKKRKRKRGPAASRTGSTTGGEAGGTTVGVIQGAVEGGKKRRSTKRDGAARLKKAADEKVAQHTEELAELLTKRALDGDVPTARLLVALAEGAKPVKGRSSKAKRKSYAQLEAWAKGPQWQGPMEEEQGTGNEGGVKNA